MGNVVSQAIADWQDRLHGTIELEDVETVSVTDNQGAETVFNVRGKVLGVRYTPGAQTISLDQRITADNANRPNWSRLRTLQITGLLTLTEVAGDGQPGERIAYNCAVVKVDRSHNNQGESVRKIELTVTKQRSQ